MTIIMATTASGSLIAFVKLLAMPVAICRLTRRLIDDSTLICNLEAVGLQQDI